MTNYEKMQLKEVAEKILAENNYRCDGCPAEKYCKESSEEKTCRETMVKWLGCEAKDD